MKIVKRFQLKIVIFTAVKIRCVLHGCVFVMIWAEISGFNIFECQKFCHFIKSILSSTANATLCLNLNNNFRFQSIHL